MRNYSIAARIKSCALLISVFLFGCASVQEEIKKEEQLPQLTSECDNSAKYARSIGTLKQAGIDVNELDQYMTNPVVTKIPMRDIQNFAMFFKGNPNQLYDTVASLCMYSGWSNLGNHLRGTTPAHIGGLKLATELKSLKR